MSDTITTGVHYPVRDLVSVITLMTRRDYRGEWRWFRLANGDLICGFFPQDEGYFAVEDAVSEDYLHAEAGGQVRALTATDEELDGLNDGDWDEPGGGPLGMDQRQWEEHYRAHSSSITGIYEGD
jgi:hypothetical protein